MKTRTLLTLCTAVLVAAACVPLPPLTPAPAVTAPAVSPLATAPAVPAQATAPAVSAPATAAAISAPATAPAAPLQPVATGTPATAAIPAGWQTYTNAEAGFSVRYPPGWTAQLAPEQAGATIHTETLKGPEGTVNLRWGVGFGGACPSGYTTVKVAQGELQTCYTKNADGTESWGQISKQLPTTSFQADAQTSNSQPASHDLILQILSTLAFMEAPAAATPAAAFSDPFAYCAAVGTIDAPDERYTGPAVPESIAAGLQSALNLPGTPAPPVAQGTFWRCLNGKVYACTVGANLPCQAKANTERTPSAEMQSFCQEQPNAEVIPAAVTGRETVYAWRCTNGVPAVGEQVFQVDPRGFIADIWYEVPNPAEGGTGTTPAATPAAALRPLDANTCAALANGMALALGVPVTRSEEPITDPTTMATGTGCQATATGTGEQFQNPDTVAKGMAGVLKSLGWAEDPKLAAGGPTGIGIGLRSGQQMCLAAAVWRPSPDANCPTNQPISACQVTPAQQLYTITLNCAQTG